MITRLNIGTILKNITPFDSYTSKLQNGINLLMDTVKYRSI